MKRVLPFYKLTDVSSIIKFINAFPEIRRAQILNPVQDVFEIKLNLPWYYLWPISNTYVNRIQSIADSMGEPTIKVVFTKD